jgi:abhydrolase domain-containing protein 15
MFLSSPYRVHLKLLYSYAYIILSVLGSVLVGMVRRLILRHRTRLLPKLHHADTPINRHLARHCSALHRPFCPPWFMENTHAQTIAAAYLPQPPMAFRRELLKLEDGGVLAVDWAMTRIETLIPTSPVLFILTGLAGDARDFQHLCIIAIEKGFRPVVFNKRGHGGCKLSTPVLQRFGDPSDFKHVVSHVSQLFPEAPLTVVGTSAGSGLMTSYLGAERENTPLLAAVALCPGYDAERVFRDCVKPPYDYFLVQGLHQIVHDNRSVLELSYDVTAALETRTVHELEERLYCRIHGYSDIHAYWQENDPRFAMWHVAIPMLSVTARDDPVCVQELVPYNLFQDNKNIILALMEKGGHCGFIEEGTHENWSQRVALDFIISVLEYKNVKIPAPITGQSNGQSNGTMNNISNATSNGLLHRASNGTSNGTVNETTNGTPNGTSNGVSNGTSQSPITTQRNGIKVD